MNIHSLPKIRSRSQKRIGRGYGSGKGGHTSSRGNKGQHARNSVAIWFEGGQLPLIKRLPFQRGKSRFKSLTANPVIIPLEKLNQLPAKTVVTMDSLIKHGLVKAKQINKRGVKILGKGKLTTNLKIEVPTSKTVAKIAGKS